VEREQRLSPLFLFFLPPEDLFLAPDREDHSARMGLLFPPSFLSPSTMEHTGWTGMAPFFSFFLSEGRERGRDG